ncbi:FkbM family methyltransferase [Aliiroseovarius sp. S253]|uniref:FkbM family methyltransferase n=1 Tax=Aliiroseovarius sp. S253 TaxID=3415133 RepID=UPI003C7C869B
MNSIVSDDLTFAELSAELNKRKAGFTWKFEDLGETAEVELGDVAKFSLSLAEPLSAEFTRKMHQNGRTVEPSVCLCLETVAEIMGVRTVLDIGTHYGFISLFLGCQDAIETVHSVEMNPDVVKIFEANLDLNPGVKKKCIIHNIGLSDEDIHNRDVWYHGMRLLFDQPGNKGIPKTQLDILKFETLIDRIGGLPDLIKIDIEGFEAKLVDDLRTMDCSQKRPVIMLELHGEELLNRLGSTRTEIFDALFSHDYKCAMVNWHQHLPAGAILGEVTKENLEEKLVKPHGMYLFW